MSYNFNNPRPVITKQNLIRSTYSPRVRVQIHFPEDSPHTKQEFKDECDINVLMQRYEHLGEMPPINHVAPQYLDVTGYDYNQHMAVVAGAQSLFNELPSAVRNRFGNDPAAFLDFCSDSENHNEMLKMGLLAPDAKPIDLAPIQNLQNNSTVKDALLGANTGGVPAKDFTQVNLPLSDEK